MIAPVQGRYRRRLDDVAPVGVMGLPTFVANGYGVVGAQPYETLERFMEQVGRRRGVVFATRDFGCNWHLRFNNKLLWLMIAKLTASLDIAERWCKSKGAGWSVSAQLGKGGTAPVFSIDSPEGERAIKIHDYAFSSGSMGAIEAKRIEQQIELGDHDCPSLIKVYDGGQFEDRLFLLMNRAPGQELAARLTDVPRDRIRSIIDQIARACLFLRKNDLCHRDIKSENVFISDDFEIATLLDISVIRDIHDPLGIGTDHDGQLPVVATARYSPPEYLFRLLETGPPLWHALDVYQLGGLLHDLIMRIPLFQSEYAASKKNRYRFAWIVATVVPEVHATDVDYDLVFTAHRALDKDWKRRSQLTLDDFLSDAKAQQSRALSTLGISRRPTQDHLAVDAGKMLRRIGEVASDLEIKITDHLREQNVTALHYNNAGGDDRSRLLRFKWVNPAAQANSPASDVIFTIKLAFRQEHKRNVFKYSAEMNATMGDNFKTAEIGYPDVGDNDNTVARLLEHAKASLADLAIELVKPQPDR